MSQIKYRAYIPDSERKDEDMLYQEDQYLSSFLSRVYTAFGVNHPSHLSFDIEERLMLWTGLKDKHGVEIYNDDILRLIGWNLGWDKDYEGDADENRIVYFDEGCFKVKAIDGSGYCNIDMVGLEDCEVIGNIRKNKDLLNSKAQNIYTYNHSIELHE